VRQVRVAFPVTLSRSRDHGLAPDSRSGAFFVARRPVGAAFPVTLNRERCRARDSCSVVDGALQINSCWLFGTSTARQGLRPQKVVILNRKASR